MPSRAVLRKKQRRDVKRKKADGEGTATPSHRIAPPRLGEGDENGSPQYRAAHPRTSLGADSAPPRKRSHDASAAASPLATSPAPATIVPVAKRARVEAAAPAPMPEGLTRKERHRWEASQRLERQMTKLTTTADAVKEMLADAAAQRDASGAEAAPAVVDGDAPEEPKLRHDPKFKHGTFWRERKEKRARTLFLGGLPSYFLAKQVKDFISTVVDSDPNSTDYVDQIGKDKEVVEDVDMLPVKHQSKVRHMYVTMASVPLAGCAAALLDRYRMDGKELRCNFAADKTQRGEAIRRRSAALR